MTALLASGCGYRVASTNRLDQAGQSMAVLPLRNETTTFEVEQLLTRALVEEFIKSSGFKVVDDPSSAGSVLSGAISRVVASPVTFGRAAFGSTFLVTLEARVELRERESGEILFQNDRYIFREQYVINVDVDNFFSELNPALDRIAKDFASSVVTSIRENW